MASIYDYQRETIQEAVVRVCYRITHEPSILPQRRRLPPERELWHELASCILGSQVPYEVAIAAAEHLKMARLLDLPTAGHDRQVYEARIARALKTTLLHVPGSARGRRYRFPSARATHIGRTAHDIYDKGHRLHTVLMGCKTPQEARKLIISLATGVGPKQASLFLRNIGLAENLAILDVHVLRYMKRMDLIADCLTAVSSLSCYERIESIFCEHALSLGFKPSHFDLAVWVVGRVL